MDSNICAAKHISLGAKEFSEGKIASAIKNFKKALKYKPDSVASHFNLGICYQKEEQVELAIRHYQKLLNIEPHDFEALNNLANLYLQKGELENARGAYLKAVTVNPKFSEGYYNLGVVSQQTKADEEAIFYYKKALALYPGNEKALNNLAVSYRKVGRTDDAVTTFKKALALNPDLPMTLINLGGLLMFTQTQEAYNYLKKATEVDSDNVEAFYNRGVAEQTLNLIPEAITSYRRVVKLDTLAKFDQVYGQLYNKLVRLADWTEATKLLTKLKKISDRALGENRLPPETPFISVATYQDEKRNLEIARAWSNFDKENVASYPKIKLKSKKLGDDRRIKVGYLSNDFHDHATSHLILGLLRLHNRDRFQIYAYSYGLDDCSRYRALAKKYVHRFCDIRQISDLEAAKLIAKDGIDILVDLKGHTSGCRLGILAQRPAPISVTWLGFPGTTGADFIDYLIADEIVVPRGSQKYYSEKIVYLPDTYQPNDNKQEIAKKDYKPEDFGLSRRSANGGGFVFCSFNQAYKINPETFNVWMKILKRVPQSVLWLWEADLVSRRNFQKQAKKKGVNPVRLVFSGSLPKPDHLARLRLADLALDTFTYNGHTTTSDCLWAGVPVVTLKGSHFASRVSASLLSAVGLPELITNSLREYENLAVELATHPSQLNALRYQLNAKRLSSPLFDTQKFTLNLEAAYEKIIKKHK